MDEQLVALLKETVLEPNIHEALVFYLWTQAFVEIGALIVFGTIFLGMLGLGFYCVKQLKD